MNCWLSSGEYAAAIVLSDEHDRREDILLLKNFVFVYKMFIDFNLLAIDTRNDMKHLSNAKQILEKRDRETPLE